MKILFALSSPEYLRYYDETIHELAARGHHLVVAAGIVREGKFVRFEGFGDGNPRIDVAGLVPPRDDAWTRFASGVRGTMDFVRYLHPELADAPALRARMKRQALPAALQWLDRVHALPAGVVTSMMKTLEAIERVIPVGDPLSAFLAAHDPDLVLVSPLVEAASEQVDLVKAARARGVPVGTCVASWDNLTNKGDLRIPTDFVVVWNEAQKREATGLHRVPGERVEITGAQLFDRWFDRAPKRRRDDFCRMVGLPAGKPIVLFVGSSIFIARAEAEVPFVRRWIEAIRASNVQSLRDVSILLRPHPYSGPAWADADWSNLGDVAVWPRGRYNPVDEENRADFFDSMYHSEAVTGINTSAMIESAIVGRPVLSVLADEFAGSQEGTRHFRHLLPENGGFLRVASTLDEHLGQLAGVLRDPEAARTELTRFVASFIRPLGLERPCTPILADRIEARARTTARHAVRDGLPARVMRLLLAPVAALVNRLPDDRSRKPAKAARRKPAPQLPTALVIALVVPCMLATAAVLVFAGWEAAWRTPLAYEAPANIAEAAGMGMASEVLRFERLGQRADAVFPVRREIISSEITRATALEAAIWSRRLQLVQLLMREQSAVDDSTRTHLACLARDIKAEHIERLLVQGNGPACEPGSAVEQVAARGK